MIRRKSGLHPTLSETKLGSRRLTNLSGTGCGDSFSMGGQEVEETKTNIKGQLYRKKQELKKTKPGSTED